MPQRRDSLHLRELPDAAECLPTHGADRLPAYPAEYLHHRGQPELSGSWAGHAGASWAAAAVRGSGRAADADRAVPLHRLPAGHATAGMSAPDLADAVPVLPDTVAAVHPAAAVSGAHSAGAMSADKRHPSGVLRRSEPAAGVSSERECGLPDAKRGASVRRRQHRGDGMSAERECDLPDAERGASVRRRRQHRGDGMSAERECDLPDAERGASVRRRQHRSDGVPAERECDLPDAERGASVRRVHAVLSAVTRNEGGAARAALAMQRPWP
jgi:hypothetical protein